MRRLLAPLWVACAIAACAPGGDVVPSGRPPVDVWLDVDVAAGLPDRDVDDALALIQAFHSPELVVRGVSGVYGNAPLEDGFPIAVEVCETFGPAGLGVHRGAASKEELGQANPAVEAMAAALRERELSILALGPLTNIGSLVQLHPDVTDRIREIVIVAGRRPGQRFSATPESAATFPDFNLENDPEAMQILLDSGVRIVMAPWEVSSHVWLRQADLDALKQAGGSGAWIAEASTSWIARWRESSDVDGFTPFDTLGVAWVTHPELIRRFPARAWIETGPDDMKRTDDTGNIIEKPYLLVEEVDESEASVVYCYRPEPAFKAILMERLASPAKP